MSTEKKNTLFPSSTHFVKSAVSRNPRAKESPYSGFIPAVLAISWPILAASVGCCFANSATALTTPFKAPCLILAKFK